MQGEWKTYSCSDFCNWLRSEGAGQMFGVYTDTSQMFYIVPPHGDLQGEFEPIADNLTAGDLLDLFEAAMYQEAIYKWEEPRPEPPPPPAPADDPPPPPPPEESIEALREENAFLIKELDRIRKEYNRLKQKAESAGLKI